MFLESRCQHAAGENGETEMLDITLSNSKLFPEVGIATR